MPAPPPPGPPGATRLSRSSLTRRSRQGGCGSAWQASSARELLKLPPTPHGTRRPGGDPAAFVWGILKRIPVPSDPHPLTARVPEAHRTGSWNLDGVGEDRVGSFAETGWVSSDSGKEDTESRRLRQQIRESAGAPILTSRGYASPTTQDWGDHARDSNL